MKKKSPTGSGTKLKARADYPTPHFKETGKKILIIDNRENPPEDLAQMLKKYFPGVTVFTASSGKQGLEIACQEIPELVLLDLDMPDLDGFKVCKILKIHNDTQFIPVIMFTAKKNSRKEKFKALDCGADGLIEKPIDEAHLVAQVKSMLRIKNAEDRLRAEPELKKALQEKEILLREIHHRIKNNLSMVSSLLNIQSSYLKDEKAQTAFAESRKRINSIALIHEKLYRSSDLASVEFGQYIRDLAAALINSYSIPAEAVEVVIDIGDIYLNMDISIPLGLIVTELLTNSLKYGFKDHRKLTLSIRLKVEDHHFLLVVADDGNGLPEDLDWQNTETLGIQLVNLLTRQLEGHVQLERKNGTLFRFTFPGLEISGETKN